VNERVSASGLNQGLATNERALARPRRRRSTPSSSTTSVSSCSSLSASGPVMETIENEDRVNPGAHVIPGVTSDENIRDGRQRADAPVAKFRRSIFVRWLLHDSPYITMLLLALVGVIFRPPVSYWVILTPVFGVISVAAGLRHFVTPNARLELVYKLALCWSSVLLAIYLLYDGGVQGVLNANANSLAMMILLALGTFVAGVQASVWRICAVGGILFLAVPGLGWLDQSPLLLAAATLVIIAVGGLAWWVSQLGGQGGGRDREALLEKTAVA
jgi:hypothetical protein